MLDFTVYKPVRSDAIAQVHAETPQKFAEWFAATISRATSCEISGSFDGTWVHLHTQDENMERVSDALEARGLTHGF